eukprot:6908388-Pyramimonas_sp.AAC.1
MAPFKPMPWGPTPAWAHGSAYAPQWPEWGAPPYPGAHPGAPGYSDDGGPAGRWTCTFPDCRCKKNDS